MLPYTKFYSHIDPFSKKCITRGRAIYWDGHRKLVDLSSDFSFSFIITTTTNKVRKRDLFPFREKANQTYAYEFIHLILRKMGVCLR